MVKYVWKHYCKQFIRGKPIRFGYKVWCLTSVEGAEIRTLPFHFFFDNLFTGLHLLSFLRDKGYGGTGTMRNNRIPKSCQMTSNSILLKKERSHHESAIVKEDGVIVSKLVDNSIVSIGSNCLGVEPQCTVKRYSQEKRII
ncbi:hypothetical protein PR048_014869 [Dryococelus australis]|uniref:PiggyBac transposable element-derived protein domain-containing protein n=1 Tax=Dryococelus australis TaxID=614101 RepID=A0ABQ9HFL5_9NEOP|nr:hypothetical protein PR048_014869 [Dryococelus australis]